MRRALTVLAIALAGSACGAPAAAAGLIEPGNPVVRATKLPVAWSTQAAARLTLEQQVGQVVVGGFDGRRAPRFVRSALARDRMAGVILFAANVGSPGELRRLTASLRTASRRSALVSVDQEGGLVRRIPFAGPRPGQPRQGSPARVRRIARAGAADLRRLGVNVDYAPVADVPTGPGADIYERAFRGSPADVGRKVAAAVRGYGDRRVAATAKHFPGLGAAPRNTDDASVVIRRSAAALDRVDLAPFRAAVAAGTPLVMAAHARYPALDRTHLASQSRAILDRLLRGRMGYRGVVVTDALEAQAVLRRLPVERAAERSLAAGADLLLLTRPASYGRAVARLRARARSSPALRARLRTSVARVLELKRSLGLRVPGA